MQINPLLSSSSGYLALPVLSLILLITYRLLAGSAPSYFKNVVSALFCKAKGLNEGHSNVQAQQYRLFSYLVPQWWNNPLILPKLLKKQLL